MKGIEKGVALADKIQARIEKKKLMAEKKKRLRDIY
jgi:hypothetical protein